MGPFFKIHGRIPKGDESLPGDGIMFLLDEPGETTPPCCCDECNKVREESNANPDWLADIKEKCNQLNNKT